MPFYNTLLTFHTILRSYIRSQFVSLLSTNTNFMKSILIVAALVGIAAAVLIAYSTEGTPSNELKAPPF